MPVFGEHIRQLFNRLHGVDPRLGIEHEGEYYEIRAELDVVQYVGNEQNLESVFDVVFVGAGMTEENWTGFFKVDIHPDFLFEVTYVRKDHTSSLSYYRIVPQRSFRTRSRRKAARFDEEISLMRGNY